MASRERLNEVRKYGQRWYELPNGTQVPSVTTVLSVLPKKALDAWKLKTTAEWAFDNIEAWRSLPRDAAVSVIQGATNYNTFARDAGNIAHHVLEMRSIGRDVDVHPGYEGASRAWDEFTKDFDVEVLHAEPQLINRSVGYAGSADLLAKVNGEISVIDYKGGNGLYGSTSFQLSAYANAETLLVGETEIEMPKVTRTFGMWVRPEGYALHPMELSKDTWNVFRAAHMIHSLALADWKYKQRAINPNPLKKSSTPWGPIPAGERD